MSDQVVQSLGAAAGDASRATGRGNVLYHRHDGLYGLIAPE